MAGSAVIGALRVTLGLDSAAFETGLEKSRASTARSTKAISADFTRMQRSLDGITKGLSASLATLGASLSISLISSGITSGLEYASALGEVAQQLGVSTRALQEYRYVATQVGIEQGLLDNGLAKLTRSIGEAASGAQVQTDAFAALGVSIRDQNGHLKTTDQILPELIAAFSKMPEPTRRAALETDLFGKAGQKLDTLLAGGVSQVDNLRNAANKLGLVLSNEQIQKADDTADKLAQVQTVLKANIAGVVADNSGAILGLADSFAKLTSNVLGSVTAFSNYRNVRGLAAGNVAAGRELLKSKSGRSALAGYYDQRLSENTAARGQRGLSAAEATRLDGEIAKVKKLRELTIAYDARKTKADLQGGGAGGGAGGGVRLAVPRAPRTSGKRAATAASGPDLGEQTRSIVDGLFPREAELRKLNESMAMLGAALGKELISLPDFQRSSTALQEQISAVSAEIGKLAEDAAFPDLKLTLNPDLFAGGKSFDDLTIGLSKFGKAANDNAENQQRATDQIIQSYADMAQGVLGSLDGLTGAIKSGDFFDILSSVIDVISQVAGAIGGTGGLFKSGAPKGADGVSGLNLGGLLPSIPARAKGGPVRAGTAYLVGERGPELFRPNASGKIIPNGQFGGGGTSVKIAVEPSPYFDARVVGISGRSVQASAPSIASAGASGAIAQQRRMEDRRLA